MSAIPKSVPHPAIVSESGRAIVAHHSVLVVEAFSSIEKTTAKLKIDVTDKDHKLVRDILDVKQRLKRGNRLESLHDIQQIKEEAQQTFILGLLDLESKAETRLRLLAACPANREHASRAAFRAGRSERTRDLTRRPIHLQFLCFSVASRSLGAGAVVPDHADPSAEHSA